MYSGQIRISNPYNSLKQCSFLIKANKFERQRYSFWLKFDVFSVPLHHIFMIVYDRTSRNRPKSQVERFPFGDRRDSCPFGLPPLPRLAGTLKSSIWEILENKIEKRTLFLYVVYSFICPLAYLFLLNLGEKLQYYSGISKEKSFFHIT